MPYIIPETDRNAEIVTLKDERNFLSRRCDNAGASQKRYLNRLIAQIDKDIARNQEQMKAILR